MTNSYFNPIGAYPLSNFDYQCLAQVMKTPNPLEPSFRGGASQSTQANTQTTTPPAQQAPPVQYSSGTEKKSHTGAWILGITSAAALIAAGRYGYKNGPATETFLKRIFEGCKSGIQKIGKSTTEKAAETAKEAVTAGKYTISKVNGKTVITMPGQKNIISACKNKKGIGTVKTANIELEKVGEGQFVTGTTKRFTPIKDKSGNVKEWKLADGNELTGFRFNRTIKNGKITENYTVIGAKTSNGNKITILKDGKPLSCTEDGYEALEQMGKEVFEGKKDFTKLDRVTIKHTNKDTGLVSTVKVEKGKETLLNAVTDKFEFNSQKVKALRTNNKTFDEALVKYEKENGNGLTALRADVQIGNGGPTYTIDSEGKVIAIKHQGKTYDAIKNKEEFDAKCYDCRADIEKLKDIKPEKWKNVVYEIPS